MRNTRALAWVVEVKISQRCELANIYCTEYSHLILPGISWILRTLISSKMCFVSVQLDKYPDN